MRAKVPMNFLDWLARRTGTGETLRGITVPASVPKTEDRRVFCAGDCGKSMNFHEAMKSK
jgi:hypothetical protein